MLGVHEAKKTKLITDTQALKTTNMTTLGLIIEDPSQPTEIAEKLLIYFERGSKITATASERPKTTFLTSMNNTSMQGLTDYQIHIKSDPYFFKEVTDNIVEEKNRFINNVRDNFS